MGEMEIWEQLKEKGIHSSRFRIPYNARYYDEPLSALLKERGVDSSYIPTILKKLEWVSSKTWYHKNRSYNAFKWDIPNIDKYVDGLYYIDRGTVCKPDKKTMQAIKRLIECYQEKVAPPVTYTNIEPDSPKEHIEKKEEKKSHLSIHLNLTDPEGFFKFLHDRPINRQTRERYYDDVPFPKDTSGNSNRSTFVEKDVSIDTTIVDVFVNGKLTSDVGCRIEEFADSYVIHLFYKGERAYWKSFTIEKELAKEPIRYIHYNEAEDNIGVNGKSLSVTFRGYDDYKRFISGKPSPEPSDKPSTIYVGKPEKERQTQLTKNTTVTKTDNEVRVVIDDSKETVKQDTDNTVEIPDTNTKKQIVKAPSKKQRKKRLAKTQTNLDDEFDDLFDEEGDNTKICFRCHRELPFSKFARTKYSFDGYEAYCKECCAEILRIEKERDKSQDQGMLGKKKMKDKVAAVLGIIITIIVVLFLVWMIVEHPLILAILVILLLLL